MATKPDTQPTTLKRSLTTPLLTLYGLGVTIGAGIYVLIGATAAKAGFYAPISFLLAAAVVAFTGFSYCELGTRYPVSAGEAVYVRHGLNSKTLSLIVGLMVAASGVVSSAAISIGAAGYLENLLPLPPTVLTILVILLLGLTAAWGITESIVLAAIFTVIEIAGLGLVIYFALDQTPEMTSRVSELIPPMEGQAWSGILAASMLAFFAFVGFEDIANVAEEVKNPRHTMPRAILLTLIIVAVLYMIVVSVVVLAVPMDTLATSAAPLALIFVSAGPTMKSAFNVIASIATINGVLVMMIMASRVLYGLAVQGSLPGLLASVHPKTRTPLIATGLVVAIILFLALALPIADLAELTSQIVLLVFVLVNLSLMNMKRKGSAAGDDVFVVPGWVPVLGFLTSGGLLLAGFL